MYAAGLPRAKKQENTRRASLRIHDSASQKTLHSHTKAPHSRCFSVRDIAPHSTNPLNTRPAFPLLALNSTVHYEPTNEEPCHDAMVLGPTCARQRRLEGPHQPVSGQRDRLRAEAWPSSREQATSTVSRESAPYYGWISWGHPRCDGFFLLRKS